MGSKLTVKNVALVLWTILSVLGLVLSIVDALGGGSFSGYFIMLQVFAIGLGYGFIYFVAWLTSKRDEPRAT